MIDADYDGGRWCVASRLVYIQPSHVPLEQRPAISSLLVMMRFKLELKAFELSSTHAHNEAARKEFEASQRNVVGMLFGDKENPSDSEEDEQAAGKVKVRSASATSGGVCVRLG